MIHMNSDGRSFSVLDRRELPDATRQAGAVGGPIGPLLVHHRGFIDPFNGRPMRFVCYGRQWGGFSFRAPNQWDPFLRVLGLREKPFDDVLLVIDGSDEVVRYFIDLLTLLATCRDAWPLAYDNYLAALDALNNDPDDVKTKRSSFTIQQSRHREPLPRHRTTVVDQYVDPSQRSGVRYPDPASSA